MARLAGGAFGGDPDLFRGLLETVLCLALPQQVMARPGIQDKLDGLGLQGPLAIPGPDREQLLQLLDGGR